MRTAALPLLALTLTASAARSTTLVYGLTPGPGASVRVTERLEGDSLARALPDLPDPRGALRRWVEESATAVAAFYGRLPAPRVTVSVRVVSRGAIGGGVTLGGGRRGARIEIDVGPELSEEHLADDWVLTHELVHTAVPRLPEESKWLDEGIATYVEPLARVRRGSLAPDKVWIWLAWGVPQGLPQAGDEGLDRTHTWGRTYWGGALFCFLADVELRERTRNRMSLREALIGVLNAGGDVNAAWSSEDVFAAGDRATGLRVLRDLHDRMGTKPLDPDIPALLERLGVKVREGRVTYNDKAPLAEIRKTLPSGATSARDAPGRSTPAKSQP